MHDQRKLQDFASDRDDAAFVALPEFSAYAFLSRQLQPLMRALILAGTASYGLFVAGCHWLSPADTPLAPRLAVLAVLLALGALSFLPLNARRLTALGLGCLLALQLGILVNGQGRGDPVEWLLPGFLLVPLAASPAWMSHRHFALALLLSLAGPLASGWLYDLPFALEMQCAMYLLIALGAATVLHVFTLRQLQAQWRLEQRLREIAYTDPLTGIANRTHFFAEAPRLLATVRQQARPLCALFLDLDHFKAINDRHGHAAGDAALVAVATRLCAHLHDGDLLGRIGGEEFAVLLPGADRAEAVRTAERLRTAVASLDLSGGPLSISIGVAELRRDDARIDVLLAAADQALGQAKQLGRNRVEVAGTRRDDERVDDNVIRLHP